jgi:septal ring factor EnvC (AmiA/AmiB activator)
MVEKVEVTVLPAVDEWAWSDCHPKSRWTRPLRVGTVLVMVLGLDVGWMRNALLFSPVAFTLIACTPPAVAPPQQAAGNSAASPAFFPAGANGRSYAFGQVLAREQEHSVTLQEQLQDRTREIQQLRTELQEVRQHETQLRTALSRAAAALEKVPGVGHGEGSAVASARGRPHSGGGTGQPAGGPAASAANATASAGDAPPAAAVANLRSELAREQKRRQSVETQLARLKEETSTPPYAPKLPDAALTAAKKQVADLQTALAKERRARQRLAEDFQALQQRVTQEAAATHAAEDNAELRAQLERLQAEKDALSESFNRSLNESRKRTWDLEQQLATARVAAAALPAQTGDADASAIRQENVALRARLDEEHRQTEELAAKLQLAARVTDLIFKMQAQQLESPAPEQ